MSTNLARFFERKYRPTVTDGQSDSQAFYALTEDAPDWLHDAVRDAHDGELPDDWRYDTAHSIVCMFDDGYDPTDDDAPYEIAGSLVDVYTHDLFAWIAGDVSRSTYVDDIWHSEYGSQYDSLESSIRGGQYVCIEQMTQILASAIAENMEQES